MECSENTCKYHQEYSNDIAVMKTFMREGLWWRATIVGIVVMVIGAAFTQGKSSAAYFKQVEVNTARLDRIEGILDKMANYLAQEVR